MTKYSALMERKGQTLVAVASGANMDFDRLHFVSERADTSETLIAVQIPERAGAFLELYKNIYPRNVTEFSYRISGEPASIFMSFQATGDNELAKVHARHMAGGRAPAKMTEEEILLMF